MATRKNRPIMYEVVRRNRRAREGSWRRPAAAPLSGSVARPAPAGPPLADVPDQIARSFRIVGGRLQVNLAWPGMLVVAVGAIAILAVAFQAGVRYARSHAVDRPAESLVSAGNNPEAYPGPSEESAVEEAPFTPVQPAVAPRQPEAGQPSAVVRPPEPAPAAFAFREGYHYVVVQHFPAAHLPTAQEAAKFLRARGIECVIERGKDVQLIATEGFLLRHDDKRTAEAEKKRCDAFKARIRELGKEFSQQQRNAGQPEYAFEQCYERRRAK